MDFFYFRPGTFIIYIYFSIFSMTVCGKANLYILYIHHFYFCAEALQKPKLIVNYLSNNICIKLMVIILVHLNWSCDNWFQDSWDLRQVRDTITFSFYTVVFAACCILFYILFIITKWHSQIPYVWQMPTQQWRKQIKAGRSDWGVPTCALEWI